MNKNNCKMMDLSEEVRDLLVKVKLLVKESEESIALESRPSSSDMQSFGCADDIIDINKINFDDDETWLCKSSVKNSNFLDLKTWLYHEPKDVKDIEFHSKRLMLMRDVAQIDTKKSIDSRTFTRPKKRLSRPSIEHYNEGYFKMEKYDNKYLDDDEVNSTVLLGENFDESFQNDSNEEVNSDADITVIKNITAPPLNFDYSQPTTSSLFEKIIANAPDVDSFVNMSPPSLVNSMCSSTFANLMENSYIKNDPTLREIRDADLTDSMIQDYDQPLFESFPGSCSSICSDTVEQIAPQMNSTFTNAYNKNTSNEKENLLNETYGCGNIILDTTFRKDSSSDCIDSTDTYHSDKQTPTRYLQHGMKIVNPDETLIINTKSTLNGTYRKSLNSKLNNTYKKSPSYQSNDDLNRTITVTDNMDSNRLNTINKRYSYSSNSQKKEQDNLKRNSFGYSAGSTDSLDYMSSLSNSSRGSNKMLNMAEVDAIVLQQEQSLQVMSTPKSASKVLNNKLWGNSRISPIISLDRGDQLSDSEASSNDDYLTVGSSTSNILSPCGSETQIMNSVKSLDDRQPVEMTTKTNPRSSNSIPTMKTISNNNNKKIVNNFRGSYTNLKTAAEYLKGSSHAGKASQQGKGSYSNLASTASNLKGSYTNLKTMSNHLKTSYTQLKPVLTNLPVTDIDFKSFQPKSLKKGSIGNVRIAEVAPTLRDTVSNVQIKSTSTNNGGIKLQPKASGLPRPVSAIPRPSASRIPAPRIERPGSLRQPSRPLSKYNFEGAF